jgi:hypothetical protein
MDLGRKVWIWLEPVLGFEGRGDVHSCFDLAADHEITDIIVNTLMEIVRDLVPGALEHADHVQFKVPEL